MGHRAVIVSLTMLLLFSLNSYAQEDKANPDENSPSTVDPWTVESSLTYSSGDFGTATNTSTLYWPITIRRNFERGDASFTIPFIDQRSGPGISVINGHPMQVSRATAGPKRSASGLGDLLLDGRYHLFTEPEENFNLSAMAGLKFPTADEDKGLGTGEFDQTLGLESDKTLNDLWSLFFDLYYTFIGDPPGTDLNNQLTFKAGTGYKVDDRTTATLAYQESTALVDDQDNPRDIILGLIYATTPSTQVHGDLDFGVSEGSPDWAITGGLSYFF